MPKTYPSKQDSTNTQQIIHQVMYQAKKYKQIFTQQLPFASQT